MEYTVPTVGEWDIAGLYPGDRDEYLLRAPIANPAQFQEMGLGGTVEDGAQQPLGLVIRGGDGSLLLC